MTSQTMQVLLVLFLAAMSALALLSLRHRPLKWHELAAWGLLALLVPAIGPFVVIIARPGGRKARSEIVRERSRRLKP